MNIKFLEQETWADRVYNSLGNNKIVGPRVKLFELLDVPSNVIEQMLFAKKQEEVQGEMKTFESLRSFRSLPRWLKKRMKFRLKHQSEFPAFDAFVENLIN